MQAIFNIGLNLPKGGTLHAASVRKDLADVSLRPTGPFDSQTEPTMVAAMSICDAREASLAAKALCTMFQQDAVAYYLPELGLGGLAGPKADEWGPFDPSLFILPCGSRITS